MYYLLTYDVVANYLELRPKYRQDHIDVAKASVAKGELILGGALAEPVDGVVLLFKGDTANVATDFAEKDPYVLNGLVKNWKVRPWSVVIGAGASAIEF